MLFFLFVLIIVVYIGLLRDVDIPVRLEEDEINYFPSYARFNESNIMQAYIGLACLMIQKNTRNGREKVQFLQRYFFKHYPDYRKKINESLSNNIKNPYEFRSLISWFNKHLPDTEKRTQVIHFLIGLGMIDGQINENEYLFLKQITLDLNLSMLNLDALVNMYRFEYERKQAPSSYRQKNMRESALKTLMLDGEPSEEEIKSAYRKLVKLHHPDRFSNDTKEQQRLAHERFLKLQEAYEFLCP